jgi:hypothetical protein
VEPALVSAVQDGAHEALHPETSHGGGRGSSRQVGDLPSDRFTADTAKPMLPVRGDGPWGPSPAPQAATPAVVKTGPAPILPAPARVLPPRISPDSLPTWDIRTAPYLDQLDIPKPKPAPAQPRPRALALRAFGPGPWRSTQYGSAEVASPSTSPTQTVAPAVAKPVPEPIQPAPRTAAPAPRLVFPPFTGPR